MTQQVVLLQIVTPARLQGSRVSDEIQRLCQTFGMHVLIYSSQSVISSARIKQYSLEVGEIKSHD